MTTVTDREQLRQNTTGTALFVGADHGAGVSFFWVDTPPGGGPETHWHPYTETWVVLRGEAVIESDGEQLRAGAGAIVTVHPGAQAPLSKQRYRESRDDLHSCLSRDHSGVRDRRTRCDIGRPPSGRLHSPAGAGRGV
jgi:hypothetical protein